MRSLFFGRLFWLFDKKIAKVFILRQNGRQLLLEDATIEEIRQILDG
ncbi:hypothetical protein [Coleofasciculus sp. H7-2]